MVFGSGFVVQVWGLGLRVSGMRDSGLGIRVEGFLSRVGSLGFRVEG